MTPTITDWISAIASIIGTVAGLPLIIVGIFRLFKKDKQQERKLNSLENLATSQNEVIEKMSEQIVELSNQTFEFQQQSASLVDLNKLISKQIDLQNSIFLHDKDIEEKKLELERMKHLNEIKPYFRFSSGTGSSITLTNEGKTAKNLQFGERESDDFHFTHIDPKSEIRIGEKTRIMLTRRGEGQRYDIMSGKYKVELCFEDIDGNKYKQEILNGKIGPPELTTRIGNKKNRIT
jgi:hypothetical protein